MPKFFCYFFSLFFMLCACPIFAVAWQMCCHKKRVAEVVRQPACSVGCVFGLELLCGNGKRAAEYFAE